MESLHMTCGLFALLLMLGVCVPETHAADKDATIKVPLFGFTASDYKPDRLEKAKSANRVFGCGQVTYSVDVQQAGMYALYVGGARWETHIRVNGNEVAFARIDDVGLDNIPDGPEQTHQLVNVLLKQGANTLSFERKIFPSMSYLFGIRFVRDQRPQTRVSVQLPDYKGYYRKGQNLAMQLTAEALDRKDYNIVIQLDSPDKTSRVLQTIHVAAQAGMMQKSLQLPMDFDGQATLRVTVDGKNVCMPASVVAMDVNHIPQTSGSIAEPQRVVDIDCTKTAPQYHGNGDTRITTHANMTYRESADSGVYNEGWKQASWFAYKLDHLQVGQRYRVTVDYPDDKTRTFTVGLIDQPRYGHSYGLIPYALDTGVASGGEFANSNTMQSVSIDFNARREDARVMFLNWHAPLRAAAARIRVYRIDENMPALKLAHPSLRHQAMFYEEYDRWFGYFTALDDSQAQLLKAADRYARWCKAAGFDTFWETVAIYGTACWPSKLLDHASVRGFLREDHYPTGIMRPLLLTAERYGMRYIAELHPTPNLVNLPKEQENAEIYTVDSRGRTLLNPLHPIVQQWGEKLVHEVAEHGAFSPAFAGVSIRWMGWANCGWASFNGVDAGMDDWTITQFAKDTDMDPAKLLKMKAAQRWGWINSNKHDAFLSWKTNRMTNYYRKLLTSVRSARPDLKLYVHRFGDSSDYGFTDISKLAAVDGVELTRFGRSYPPTRRIKDASRFAAAGVSAGYKVEEAGDNGFFSNIYMETDFMIDQLGMGSQAGEHMRVCGAINPPGRQMLKRYVLYLAEHPLPQLWADGGLGYMQGSMALRQEFAQAYLPLPVIEYQKLSNDDPVALWQGQKDGKCYVYMINTANAPVTVQLQCADSTLTQLADNASVASQRIELPAYAMRSYLSGSRVTGLSTSVPAQITQRLDAQLQSAQAIIEFPKLDSPQILDLSPEDYAQARRQLTDAEKALKQGQLRAYAKLLRWGMVDNQLRGLAKLYEARGQYPDGIYTIDQPVSVASHQTQSHANAHLKLVRRIGDIRKVLVGTLDQQVDESGRIYLLQPDDRVVVQYPQGHYLQTLYADKRTEQCQSLRIVNGWVMLSAKPGTPVKVASSQTVTPFASGAMHPMVDGSVGFLADVGTDHAALYTLIPQQSEPRLLLKLPSVAASNALDFCVSQQRVYLSGRYRSKGQIGIWSLPLKDGQPKRQFIFGALGNSNSVNLFGMVPTNQPDRIIIRKTDAWPKLSLAILDCKTNTTTPFFDIQHHYKLKPHHNIYNLVKHFPPWALAYQIQAYPDGSGYALLVSPLCTVYRLDREGKFMWAAGIKPENTGTHRPWSYPADISIDAKGNLWVVDRDTSVVDQLDTSGKLLQSFGQPGRLDAVADDAFWQPRGIAATHDAQGRDYLYVGDTGNSRTVEFEIR